MKFFFDNNVPINLARGLTELEPKSSPVDILHCQDRWPPDGAIDDVDWIPVIASEGRIILTFDRRILTNVFEREAYIQSKAIILVPEKFIFKLSYCDRVIWTVQKWPKIKAWARKNPSCGAFRIQQNGEIGPISRLS